MLAHYNVDPTRIATYGYQAGGSMALLVGLGNLDRVRAIVAIDAAPPARTKLPENDPINRLAFFLGTAEKSATAAQIKAVVARLEAAKFPVTQQSLGEQPREVTADELGGAGPLDRFARPDLADRQKSLVVSGSFKHRIAFQRICCESGDVRTSARLENFAVFSNRTRFNGFSGRSLPSGLYTWGDFSMHAKSLVLAALLAALAGVGSQALAQYAPMGPYGGYGIDAAARHDAVRHDGAGNDGARDDAGHDAGPAWAAAYAGGYEIRLAASGGPGLHRSELRRQGGCGCSDCCTGLVPLLERVRRVPLHAASRRRGRLCRADRRQHHRPQRSGLPGRPGAGGRSQLPARLPLRLRLHVRRVQPDRK